MILRQAKKHAPTLYSVLRSATAFTRLPGNRFYLAATD